MCRNRARGACCGGSGCCRFSAAPRNRRPSTTSTTTTRRCDCFWCRRPNLLRPLRGNLPCPAVPAPRPGAKRTKNPSCWSVPPLLKAPRAPQLFSPSSRHSHTKNVVLISLYTKCSHCIYVVLLHPKILGNIFNAVSCVKTS
jgi:hypothetical protein